MDRLKQHIVHYVPKTEQEAVDRKNMIHYMELFDDLLSRDNTLLHFTASSWIVSESSDLVLMIHHNIYHSWAWTGGHADGDPDLLSVAIREASEETGLRYIRPRLSAPFSLEILGVNGHVKNGSYISPHLHLNVTYLLEASCSDTLHINPDENSGVKWMTPEEAVFSSSEPHMQEIYRKLNARLSSLAKNGNNEENAPL